MKAFLISSAAVVFAATFSLPASAQDAGEHAAIGKSAGGCSFGQAMLQASADSEQQQMEETRSKVDALVEQALASTRPTHVAQSPVIFPPAKPDS